MAVTVSITSTRILVSSTDGVQATLEEVFQACEALSPGAMTKTPNGDNWIYRITAASYRELELGGTSHVLFEANDVLEWEWGTTSGTYVILDVQTNATMTVEEGFRFDLGVTGTYRRGYFYLYGTATLNGTEENPIIFEHFRSFYPQWRGDQYWRHVIFQDVTYSSGYMIYYSNYSMYYITGLSVDIQYVTIRNTEAVANNWGRVYWTDMGFPETNWILRNWTFERIDDVYLYACTIKLENCTFKKIYNMVRMYGAGNLIGLPYETSRDDTKQPQVTFQPKMVFDGCVWEDVDLGAYSLYSYYGAQAVYKNCIMRGVDYAGTQDGMYMAYYARSFLNGDNAITFEDIQAGREFVLASNHGGILHVREVDVRVVDSEGNPIEKATVTLIQSEQREWHSGFTDANGELKNIYGDPPILVEKEETEIGVFAEWSDSIADGRFHRVLVSKAGYGMHNQAIEVTEDLDLEITLYPYTGVGAALTGVVSAESIEGEVSIVEVVGAVDAIELNEDGVVVKEITGEVDVAEIEGNIQN
jgi:hypothetical protein